MLGWIKNFFIGGISRQTFIDYFWQLIDNLSWMIWWFIDIDNKSFGFLYGLYVPLFKLNVISKKSAILRLVSTSMAKPMSLNVLIIFLRIRSIYWPFTFRNISSPSSLYKPQFFYWLVSLKNTRCKYQQVRIPLHRQNFPLSHRSSFLFVSFSMLHCC